jgi:hypothetical protein
MEDSIILHGGDRAKEACLIQTKQVRKIGTIAIVT